MVDAQLKMAVMSEKVSPAGLRPLQEQIVLGPIMERYAGETSWNGRPLGLVPYRCSHHS
jgi:hypothetical protein